MRVLAVVLLLAALTTVSAFVPTTSYGLQRRIGCDGPLQMAVATKEKEKKYSKEYMEQLKANAIMAQKATEVARSRKYKGGPINMPRITIAPKKYSDAYMKKLKSIADTAQVAAEENRARMYAETGNPRYAPPKKIRRGPIRLMVDIVAKILVPWRGIK